VTRTYCGNCGKEVPGEQFNLETGVCNSCHYVCKNTPDEIEFNISHPTDAPDFAPDMTGYWSAELLVDGDVIFETHIAGHVVDDDDLADLLIFALKYIND